MNINEVLRRINEKVKLERLWMNDEWLLQQKNKLRITERDYDFLVGVKIVMQQLYPDRFDIWLYFKEQDSYNRRLIINSIELVIHYPKVTVTNDKDYIDITDLFVKFQITTGAEHSSGKMQLSYDVKGTRTSCSYVEFVNNYFHSHLSSEQYRLYIGKFHTFCTGTSEMNAINLVVKANLSNRDVPIDFNLVKMLFYQMNSFVQWQSDEGTPYIAINRVTLKKIIDENDSLSLPTGWKNCLYTKINDYEPKLGITLLGEKVRVIPGESLVEFLDKKFQGTNYEELNKHYYDEVTNKYYELRTLSSRRPNLEGREPFIFNGQVIPYNIRRMEGEELENYNNVVNNLQKKYTRTFLNYVTAELESKINEKVFKNYISSK